jgi:hypothetical protein
MTPTGFELDSVSTIENSKLGDLPGEGAAKSGAVDPDLSRLLSAWPTLADPIRRAILALVESGK